MRAGLILILSPFLFAFLFHARAPRSPEAPQKSELKFSHVLHVVDEELACDDCHADVTESVSGADDLLPTKEVCSDCHEVDEEEECGTCHTDTDAAELLERITTYSQKFSHQKHSAYGLECEACHAAVLEEPVIEEHQLPGMLNCVDCHESKSVSVDCETCHMPDDELRPTSHFFVDFLHSHSDLARNDAHPALNGLQCQTCHDDDFCQDCHEGDNLDRFTHPLNYQFTHALDARGQEFACVSCHTEPVFCIDCHRDNQVLPQNHRPGWVNRVDGGLHRFEAEADLNNCIACHDDNADLVCQPCHAD